MNLFMWCIFFFFKQKTAYEMRISDWSSDVCSSDLGAAKAIAFSLAAAGVSKITIFNRTACKAEELTRRLSTVFPTLELSVASYDPSGHDLVVNSTSLGLSADDILPLDVTLLTPSQIVAEIIMKPRSEEHTSDLQSLMRKLYAVY